MTAYYNELDPFAAQWLRNLIAAGHIAPGDVDERSIEDVRPDDLKGYTQCHFFAGVGVWSLALRRAGWEDSRPIWTGSCPCQPFSASGKSCGFADERHLWPAFYWLIKQRRPGVVTGEQVASKAAEPWLDLVQTDLEALGYAFGALAFPSAGVGAPHIRDRTYWVGHTHEQGPQGLTGDGRATEWRGSDRSVAETGVPVRMADAEISGERALNGQPEPRFRQEKQDRGHSLSLGMADAERVGLEVEVQHPRGIGQAEGFGKTNVAGGNSAPSEWTRPTNGYWANVDWLFCRDGKWRPVEPGTFPLANGPPARVGRLRAYGNAINAEAATVFSESFKEALDEQYRIV